MNPTEERSYEQLPPGCRLDSRLSRFAAPWQSFDAERSVEALSAICRASWRSPTREKQL